ncbi:MAG: helix-turn-helix domain-containing protein [Myxococcota bacterium]
MTRRALVVGLDPARSRAVAGPLRAAGWAVAEGVTPADVDGIGFDVVVAHGCDGWFARLRAEGRPGARIALSDAPADARHADALLPTDATPDAVLAAVTATAPRLGTGRWHVGAAVVDLDRRTVGDAELGPQDAALLAALLSADGETVSTERLLRDAWGLRGAQNTRAVDHAVHRLRPLLEPDPSAPRHLVTVRGVGLRLAGARRSADPPGDPSTDWPLDPEPAGLDPVATALDRATTSSSRVALVGPAGAGKSVLARAWARSRGWARTGARGRVLVDDFDGVGGLPVEPVVVTARGPIAGFTTVALPDRTPELGAIARGTATSLGVDAPSPDVLAALVARIGPNALGVVRFVERSAWLGPEALFERLDRGELEVLAHPGARDPRHRSLATALRPAADALPAEAVRWVLGAGEPLAPELATQLVDAGFAARRDGALRRWPALAAWLARISGAADCLDCTNR